MPVGGTVAAIGGAAGDVDDAAAVRPIAEMQDGKAVDWLEKVSDADYQGSPA